MASKPLSTYEMGDATYDPPHRLTNSRLCRLLYHFRRRGRYGNGHEGRWTVIRLVPPRRTRFAGTWRDTAWDMLLGAIVTIGLALAAPVVRALSSVNW